MGCSIGGISLLTGLGVVSCGCSFTSTCLMIGLGFDFPFGLACGLTGLGSVVHSFSCLYLKFLRDIYLEHLGHWTCLASAFVSFTSSFTSSTGGLSTISLVGSICSVASSICAGSSTASCFASSLMSIAFIEDIYKRVYIFLNIFQFLDF